LEEESRMKIACILGSPRKKGNTARVLGWVEDELRSRGHDIDRINIVDHKVNGCKECYTCMTVPDEPGCPQEDEAVAIFERLMDADAILYGSPVFCWGFSSQIKPLIDRHLCLVSGYGTPEWKSLFEGKKTGLVITCGGPEEDNADLVKAMFMRLMDYAKCDPAGALVIPLCTTPEEMTEEVRQQAVEFAREIS
jgi:multimeric flavodoxin WrbA